jgi:excisionase family DNA binding protein
MTSQATPLSANRARDRAELPRLVSIAVVAKHLGVSVRHVRRLVFERRIPYVKWGHLVRFDIADVNDWLADSRIVAVNVGDFGRPL